MGNSTDSIRSLVGKVIGKSLVLPEMQRRYVWRSTQVRDLFDSLYRGYPVGSILVWNRPDGDIDGRVLDVGESAGTIKKGETQLLLDGQQRLTSLTAILKDKELLVRWRKKSIDILFNVTHPDVEEDETLDFSEPDDDDEDVDSDEERDSLDFLVVRQPLLQGHTCCARIQVLPFSPTMPSIRLWCRVRAAQRA